MCRGEPDWDRPIKNYRAYVAKGEECSLDGCTREVHRGGLCQSHYKRRRLQKRNWAGNVKNLRSTEGASWASQHRNYAAVDRAERTGCAHDHLPVLCDQRWIEQRCRCAYCGKFLVVLNNAQIEHVVPFSKGGGHVADNVVLSCQRCNYVKRNKTLWTEWTPKAPLPFLLDRFPPPDWLRARYPA